MATGGSLGGYPFDEKPSRAPAAQASSDHDRFDLAAGPAIEQAGQACNPPIQVGHPRCPGPRCPAQGRHARHPRRRVAVDWLREQYPTWHRALAGIAAGVPLRQTLRGPQATQRLHRLLRIAQPPNIRQAAHPNGIAEATR